MRWDAFEAECPELAALARERKLYGAAAPVEDRPRRLALFDAIDISSAGYTRFTEHAWESWSWRPEEGLRTTRHPADTSGSRGSS